MSATSSISKVPGPALLSNSALSALLHVHKVLE